MIGLSLPLHGPERAANVGGTKQRVEPHDAKEIGF